MESQKEVQAFEEDKNWQGTTCDTEEDFSRKELRCSPERDSVMSEISVEAAALLLAMKLLKLVPPDFCLRPSSPLPDFCPSPPDHSFSSPPPSFFSPDPSFSHAADQPLVFPASQSRIVDFIFLQQAFTYCRSQPSTLSFEAHERDSALLLVWHKLNWRL